MLNPNQCIKEQEGDESDAFEKIQGNSSEEEEQYAFNWQSFEEVPLIKDSL